MMRLLFLAPLLVVAGTVVYCLFLRSPPPLPDMDLEAWWGPANEKNKHDINVKSFRIKFKETLIQDLRQRIKASRATTYTPPLEGVANEYGFNSKYLDEWLRYWAEDYNFAERQKFLNQYQHYKMNVQGLNIHFINVRPEVPDEIEVVPMLLIHGWPGSVREFYEAIPYLTSLQQGRNFVLEVIIPSLPGYGFSDAAVRPGLGAAEIAVVFRNLMKQLGYTHYYVQGGDWGAVIGTHMATLFPKEVLGFHNNLPMVYSPTATFLELVGSFYPPLLVDADVVDRIYPLSKRFSFLLEETGYFHLQATKPDTIGVALSDSPAGLLAYIIEKFDTWTDRKNPQATDYYTKDQLIDNLMFYWTTNSMTTAMRLYSETFNKRHFGLRLDAISTPVPTWGLQTKYDAAYQPPCILKLKFPNLVNTTVLPGGGHFIAFEQPKVFAQDVLKAVTEFRKSRNVKTEL